MIVELTEPEAFALLVVMEARYDNVVETREQTGDAEYDQMDEDQCSVLVFQLADFTVDSFDTEAVSSLSHLFEAIDNAMDTPDAFELDAGWTFDDLRSARAKLAEAGHE